MSAELGTYRPDGFPDDQCSRTPAAVATGTLAGHVHAPFRGEPGEAVAYRSRGAPKCLCHCSRTQRALRLVRLHVVEHEFVELARPGPLDLRVRPRGPSVLGDRPAIRKPASTLAATNPPALLQPRQSLADRRASQPGGIGDLRHGEIAPG